MKAQAEEGRKREGRLSLLGLSGSARLWALVALLSVLAGALVGNVLTRIHPALDPPVDISWWAIALGFALAEVYVAHLRMRSEAYSFSLSEVPLVVGLFVLSPLDLVLAQLVGAAAALLLHRRQPLLKLSFNLGHLCVQASLAAMIFHAIAGDATRPSSLTWVAATVATCVTTVFGVAVVTAAIALSSGRLNLDPIPRSLGYGLTAALMNTAVALLGAVILWRDPEAVVLLLVPVSILILAYRSYSHQRDKHESLESLYESTRLAQRGDDLNTVVATLLARTRAMFDAEVASITFFSEGLLDASVITMDAVGGLTAQEGVTLDPREGVWARVASEGTAVLIPRPISNARLREHFATVNVRRDAMVAPIFGDEGVVGTLLVGDRTGDVSTFDQEDLTLFETLANHASVTLQKARLVEQLSESLQHLTEMNQLKDDFVAAVSHELRTPLTSIQGYVKTMLRPEAGRLTQEQRDSFLVAVERQSERLRNLIEDLLVVSRLEAHEVTPLLSSVHLERLVDGVLVELRDSIGDRQVNVQIADDVSRIHSDEGKIFQVLSNFLDNALKYSPPDSPVTVRVVPEGDGVTISVEDRGTGIPEEAQDRIFERFYQVDQSSTRAVGGTGLGLYICRRLAEAVGGRVWLESSGTEGSTFSLWVPRMLRLPAATPLSSFPGGTRSRERLQGTHFSRRARE